MKTQIDFAQNYSAKLDSAAKIILQKKCCIDALPRANESN
jgi:hypothetical protein